MPIHNSDKDISIEKKVKMDPSIKEFNFSSLALVQSVPETCPIRLNLISS